MLSHFGEHRDRRPTAIRGTLPGAERHNDHSVTRWWAASGDWPCHPQGGYAQRAEEEKIQQPHCDESAVLPPARPRRSASPPVNGLCQFWNPFGRGCTGQQPCNCLAYRLTSGSLVEVEGRGWVYFKAEPSAIWAASKIDARHLETQGSNQCSAAVSNFCRNLVRPKLHSLCLLSGVAIVISIRDDLTAEYLVSDYVNAIVESSGDG